MYAVGILLFLASQCWGVKGGCQGIAVIAKKFGVLLFKVPLWLKSSF